MALSGRLIVVPPHDDGEGDFLLSEAMFYSLHEIVAEDRTELNPTARRIRSYIDQVVWKIVPNFKATFFFILGQRVLPNPMP